MPYRRAHSARSRPRFRTRLTESEKYREERSYLAFAWFMVWVVTAGPGAAMALAGNAAPADRSLRDVGLFLVGLGTLALIGAGVQLYLGAHRPSAAQELRLYILRQLGWGFLSGSMAAAALAGAWWLGPWYEEDLGGFLTALALAAMMVPLAIGFTMTALRRRRWLRRLVGARPAAGVRLRTAGYDAREGEVPWLLIDGAQQVAVPLIPRQDLSHLTDADGFAEVLGDVRPGSMILLRDTRGTPVWPCGPARSPDTGRVVFF
jgi:hypothetical protein